MEQRKITHGRVTEDEKKNGCGNAYNVYGGRTYGRMWKIRKK